MLYDWLKAIHVIAVVCWMAGLFYLPRLFVYHAMSPVGKHRSDTFKIMERKLMNYIMWPSFLATAVFGFWLMIENPDLWIMPYMWAKLAMVVLLSIFHFVLAHFVKVFAKDANTHSHKFYRVLNEMPTVLLIGIVIMVIVKPVLM